MAQPPPTSDTAGDPIPAGDVRFYDNYLPPVDAGDYTIAVTQTVDEAATIEGGNTIDETFTANQKFSILAPRFSMDPADVHAVFPPSSTSGTFDQNLAHIVLTKRALPWDRHLQTDASQPRPDDAPWLALLLLSPDEIAAPRASSSNPQANPTGAGTYRVSELINPPPGTLGPDLPSEYQDQLDLVTQIDVTDGGAGYSSSSPPTVAIRGGGGSGATAQATVLDGEVTSVAITNSGSGYHSDPTISFSGGGGGAAAVAHRGTRCRAIEMSTDVFVRNAPRFGPSRTPPINELQYVAHCRQVPVGDKVLQARKDAGWFSVVLGNRFPAPGPGPIVDIRVVEPGLGYTEAPAVEISGGGGSGAKAVATIDDGRVSGITLTQQGQGYTSGPAVTLGGGGGDVTTKATAIAQSSGTWVAHLVSLEGFADYLTGEPSWPDGTTKVRLASLHSWTFQCLSEEGDFKDLMSGLIAGQAENSGGEGLLLRLPGPADAPQHGTPAADASAILAEGYVPLGYDTRIGDETFAWYRGPLVPKPRAAFLGIEPYRNASAAMIYDETCGLFDVSYAVAWQIGRLAALSDQRFGKVLLDWRRTGHRVVNLLLERVNNSVVLRTKLGSPDLSSDDPAVVAELQQLLEADLLSGGFLSYLVNDFSENVAPSIPTAAVLPPVLDAAPTPAAVTPDQVEALGHLLKQPAVKNLLASLNGSATTPVGASEMSFLIGWLARLVLLHGVPFVNLVPDSRMLPPESIRFFYVDPNYLNALIDGAMSAGAQSSRDTLYYSLSTQTIRNGVTAELSNVRRKLIGLPTRSESLPSAEMAGFLLRSSVVAGWPGLEVRGYASVSGTPLKPTGQIELLRMDRLAPDVLFCLFPQPPAWIEIGEPLEGLAFGHEDNWGVDLRHVSGTDIGNVIEPKVTVEIDGYFRQKDAPAPVLDLTTWKVELEKALREAVGDSTLELGPADFAIQMVRAPEQMIFQNRRNTSLSDQA